MFTLKEYFELLEYCVYIHILFHVVSSSSREAIKELPVPVPCCLRPHHATVPHVPLDEENIRRDQISLTKKNSNH